MLASPQIKKELNLPIKSQAFLTGCLSCGVTTFPWPGCFNSMLAYVIHLRNAKIPSCVCARCALWYYKSVRFIEMTTYQRLVSVGNLN